MGWIQHHGRGRPIPAGTKIDIRHFNGDVTRGFIAGSGVTFDMDGSIIHPSCKRWSGWDHNDGGPMGPKFRCYRVVQQSESFERNLAVFRKMLGKVYAEVPGRV